MASQLPEGFTLDSTPMQIQSLPQGFTLNKPDTTTGENLLGGVEVAGTIVSSALAEPIAGVVGGLEAAARGIGNFVGLSDSDAIGESVKTINTIRDALTFNPKSKEGKAQIKAIGEFIQPAAEVFGDVESALGSATLKATDSPALAAIAHSLPTAALELLGVKGLKGSKFKNAKLSGNVAEAIQQAAPDIQTIKNRTRQAYQELDSLGIKVKPKAYERFAINLQSKLVKEGLDKDLTPKSSAAINRIVDDIGLAKSPSELETMRKIANSAARSIEAPDARLGSIIVDEIDSALDSLSSEIGGQFKQARGLAQRGFKSQSITDMIENASHTASGMENGLRIEARKILKNKKKRKGFTPDEIASLKQIEQGTTASNAAKFLGKFGISEGQATSMLGFSIGAGGGGALGSVFGPAGAATGAVGVPLLGQVAKKTAQRLTLDSAKFADDLARSGKNAKAVVRTYLKHTPMKDRNVSDLTDLLLDNNLKLDTIKTLPSSKSEVGKLISDAKFFAEEIKRQSKNIASAGLITTPKIQQEQQ